MMTPREGDHGRGIGRGDDFSFRSVRINDEYQGTPLGNHSTWNHLETVGVVFRNLERELIACIRRADIVIGCVAWLTHPDILDALAGRTAVSLIIQKEDFLRPDLGRCPSGWKQHLRRAYDRLPSGLSRYNEALRETQIYMMSSLADNQISSIRCVGNYNRDRRPAFPRMHHKFFVFGTKIASPALQPEAEDEADLTWEPVEVWTGSFNPTLNGSHSLENALLLRDPSIVNAYFREWGEVAALSEPLDWEKDWMEPEWRIGT